MNKNTFVFDELEDVKKNYKKIPDSELISCIPEITQIKISKTPAKQLTVCSMFPADYPESPLLIQLKSKTLEDLFLDGLTKLVEERLLQHKGERQVLLATHYVNNLLVDNQLCVCAGEIRGVRRDVLGAQDEIKLKQKRSQFILKLTCANYIFHVTIDVPDLYPNDIVSLTIIESNFPRNLTHYFTSQATEIARKCIQPPIKPNPKAPAFQPKPSIRPMIEFLANDCVRRYAVDICPLCKRRALPENPEDVVTKQTDDEFVDRVYCGNIFHYSCLDAYMKKPPFKDGKACPSCKAIIYHDKWRTSANVREARWAAKEAKQRELEEVVDFLS